MEIRDLFVNKQYHIILDQYLDEVLSYDLKANDSDLASKVDTVIMILYSCYYCGAYKETLSLLDKIKVLEFVKWDRWKVDFLHFEFEALLYYLFNQTECSFSIEEIVSRLEELIPKMVHGYDSSGVTIGDDLSSRIKVFKDYNQGHMPYYDVEFLYPYEPPFGEGVLDLSGCGTYVSLTIKKVPRSKDIFTSFSFKVNGYTNVDTFWPGHSWMAKERLPVVRKVLPTLNLILLRAMCSAPGKFVPLYNIEQVSSVSLAVHTYDGTLIRQTVLSTLFDTAWAGGNVPVVSFSKKDYDILSKDIHSHFGAEHFFMQFHQAKNAMNAGMYVESFLMFCTAAESMLYWWVGHISSLLGRFEDYEQFSKTKLSKCDSCRYLARGDDKPDEGRFPTVFRHITYLKELCGVENSKVKMLKQCVSAARNDQLRNDVVHGRTNSVSLTVLKQAEEAIIQMQSVFVEIEREVLSKRGS